MEPPGRRDMRLVRIARVVLWGTALGIALATVLCLSAIFLKATLPYRVACGVICLIWGAHIWLSMRWWWSSGAGRSPSMITGAISGAIGEAIIAVLTLAAVRAFILPHLFLTGIAVLAAIVLLGWSAWLVRRRIRNRLRQQLVQNDQPVRPKCGHSLIGDVSGICPECGAKIEQP